MTWTFRFRGGAWDGCNISVPDRHIPEGPPERVFMFKCGPRCGGHCVFDLAEAPLHTVVVYNREETHADQWTVTYVLGDLDKDADAESERELAGVGAGTDVSTEVERQKLVPLES